MRSVSPESSNTPSRSKSRQAKAGLAATALTLSAGTFVLAAPAYATSPGPLSIVAGIPGTTFTPAPGPATASPLFQPSSVAVDSAGNRFVGNSGDGQIDKIDAAGTLSVLANGFCEPLQLAVDAAGDLYVADDCLYGLYKIEPDGTKSVVPGTASYGEPTGVAVDPSGNIYVSYGYGLQYVVRKITTTGVNSVFAGVGSSGGTTIPGPATATTVGEPYNLATDSAGNVYITDIEQQIVDKVTPGGTLSIVAGNVGGSTPATNHQFMNLTGIAVDSAGDIFVSDRGAFRVDEITPAGAISVVAGTGVSGAAVPGPATSSPLAGPYQVMLDSAGDLLIADTDYGNQSLVEQIGALAPPSAPAPGTPTTSGGAIVFPWTAVTGAESYTVTVYRNGVAQPPVSVLTGLSYTLADPVAGDSYSFTVAAVNGAGVGGPSALSGAVTAPSSSSPSAPATPKDVPTGGATAATPGGSGYWSLSTTGALDAHGNAPDLGSQNGAKLNAPVVAVASTTTGLGYWLAASDGGVFAYGDARYLGSIDTLHLNEPVVGIVRTPDNGGYWLVGADGGVFAFGDAAYFGSLGGRRLNQPIVGMTSTPDGRGYWLAGADGGVFSFGDAGFFGSLGGTTLNKHIVGIASTPEGHGYWMVASDGGVFAFGDARFFGSLGATQTSNPVSGIVANGSAGYRLIDTLGNAYSFGTNP